MANKLRYHHHLVPRSQLAYRTLHLAISMVIDLGLDLDFDETTANRNDSPHETTTSLGANIRAWHRAAVGCYYLSSVYVDKLSL